MKSHKNAGQYKLKGKKYLFLSCGCCVVVDLRDEYSDRNKNKDIEYSLEDYCIPVENKNHD